jgi:fructosamine-3-kinase
MALPVEGAVEAALGNQPARITRLHGGMIAQAYHLWMPDGSSLVAKYSPSGKLDIEGFMLHYLAANSRLPVPTVRHQASDLLIMDFVPGGSAFSPRAQLHAAECLADLHGITAASFGLERDTLIGGVHQPNPPAQEWIPFFREQRLLYMAGVAQEAGELPPDLYRRIEKLAGHLDRLLEEPDAPALLHGDVWTTNVLAEGDRITGFLDPAIYYGHPEIELAFITLFNTFGAPFFERYHALRPISPGFMEIRRHLYNLYPLLVHVRLFGGGYVSAVDQTLRRFGF